MKKIIILFLIISSCKKIENKILPENKPKNISIENMVKDFKNGNLIKEIKGIQIEDLFYKEYFIYTCNDSSKVIKAINNIASKTDDTYSINEDCKLTTKEDLLSHIVSTERNKYTQFFWKFEKLKKFKIYTAIKKSQAHYIIFDKYSDTIYHRIEEIRE